MEKNIHWTHHLPQRTYVRLQPQRNYLCAHRYDYDRIQYYICGFIHRPGNFNRHFANRCGFRGNYN